MADLNDDTFLENLKKLTGVEGDKAEELLGSLDGEALMALTDAVAKGDAEAAKAAMQPDDVEETDTPINPLFRADDGTDGEDDDKKTRRKKKGHRSHGVEGGIEFNPGDDVEVELADGKFVDATVQLPHGPHDTVGVRIKGKLKMVDRNKVSPKEKLDEMVLGMTGLPSVSRIQQLAGIAGQPEGPAAPAATASAPGVVPDHIDAEGVEVFGKSPDCDAKTKVMSCLDELEACMMELKVADLKDVRARIYALTTRLNESRATGKKRV